MTATMFGYHYIRPALAMGGAVADSLALFEEFDIIVLCAQEWQPKLEFPPNNKAKYAISVPFDDNLRPISNRVKAAVASASDTIAEEHKNGRRVLVTCFAGRNRSGLVTGLTLMKRFGLTGESAIAEIKARRGDQALTNPVFTNYLKSLTL